MHSDTYEVAGMVAIASLKSLLVQIQSYDILIYNLHEDIAKSNICGEFCEIIEEIANKYFDMAERIEFLRADLQLHSTDYAKAQIEELV